MNDGLTFSLAERCGADGVAQTTAVVQVRDFPSSVAELPTVGRGRKFSRSRAGFSLLEVMIASGIFFMCVFTILAMVSSLLRNARSLRRIELDAGMVAAQLCKTNRLFEGTESGDFGDLYPGYSWETETYPAETNGLWQVDIVVRRRGITQPVDSMSVYVFSPESQSGFGRSTFR